MKNDPENQGALKGLKILFPDYRFLVRIGSGAYGEIWLATAPDGQYRAIKFVSKSGSGDDTRYGREHRGIQLLKTLRNIPPGIVPILDVREDPQVGFGYVMELADAERPLWQEHPEEYRPKTLRGELVARRAIPLAESVDIGIRLAGALDFLQRHRLVHRDIKPSNVLYIQGQPVLADVGLLVDTREAESLVGTPGYVPREQHGHFSGDIYSLGVLLTEISTGRPADECGFSPVEEADTDAPGFSRWMEIIARACNSNPEKRYQTAAALLNALQTLRANPSGPIKAIRSNWLWSIVGIVAVIAGLYGWAFVNRHRLAAPDQHPTAKNSDTPPTTPAKPGKETAKWTTTKKELERRIEAGAFNKPQNYPLQPHPSTRTHFTIPDQAAQDDMFIKTYSDRILVGKGAADSLADWRIIFYYHPIGTNAPALHLATLAPFDPARQPSGAPLRTWPSNIAENARIDGFAPIPPVILENHPPHNYPVWIFLTTNTPAKWEAWMADNAAILNKSTAAFYRFQEAWHHQYRFEFEAPSGNPAYDKALEQMKQFLGDEMLRRTEP